MTKKLEEEFNLPPIEDYDDVEEYEDEPTSYDIVEVEDVHTALSIAEKIDLALKDVKGLDQHDNEMDDIASRAIDSYEQLMNLGMNVSDRDAGQIFDGAAKMLKTALEAKDSKVNAKLKQIDMMIKKARLDNNADTGDSNKGSGKSIDRNELLKIINNPNQ